MEASQLQEFLWRITAAEGQIKELDKEKADQKDLEAVSNRVEALIKRVESLTTAILVFSLSMVGTGLTVMVTVLVSK